MANNTLNEERHKAAMDKYWKDHPELATAYFGDGKEFLDAMNALVERQPVAGAV